MSEQATLAALSDADSGGRSQYSMDDVEDRQLLTTPSWQVASVPDAVRVRTQRTFYGMTRNKKAHVVVNIYPPLHRDEMHCHPGSEHIFLVWEGSLTVRGIHDDEEITLAPGELIHIKAGHYYQLCNDTDEWVVLYQVATQPAKTPPVGRRSFRRAGEVKAEDINGRGQPALN